MYDKEWGFMRTPGAKGRPDLVAVNPVTGWIIAAEVKGDTHRPSEHQLKWLRIWHAVPVCLSVVWKPKNGLDVIDEMMREPWNAPSGFGWLPEPEWVYKGPLTLPG
jgi:hypothetical protein